MRTAAYSTDVGIGDRSEDARPPSAADRSAWDDRDFTRAAIHSSPCAPTSLRDAPWSTGLAGNACRAASDLSRRAGGRPLQIATQCALLAVSHVKPSRQHGNASIRCAPPSTRCLCVPTRRAKLAPRRARLMTRCVATINELRSSIPLLYNRVFRPSRKRKFLPRAAIVNFSGNSKKVPLHFPERRPITSRAT